MLVFKRLLAGLTCTTPLVLRNTGTIPAHVAVEVLHGGQSFCLYPGGSTAMMPCLDDGCTASSLPPVTSEIEAGGTGEFLIVFGPQGVARHTGELLLRIKDNHFENTAILLLGESYQDDLTIENIRSLGFDATAVESEQDEQESQSSGTWCGQVICRQCFLCIYGSSLFGHTARIVLDSVVACAV